MRKFSKFLAATVILLSLASCGSTNCKPDDSKNSQTTSEETVPFVVGTDSVVATTEGASQYAPTYTVNVKIVGGSDTVLFNGKVKLTSDTMLASEFTAEAVADKGLAQDGIATGFVNTIGDYTGGAVGDDYYYWGYTVNSKYADWGCNQFQMRDGDYLLWSFVKYVQ